MHSSKFSTSIDGNFFLGFLSSFLAFFFESCAPGNWLSALCVSCEYFIEFCAPSCALCVFCASLSETFSTWPAAAALCWGEAGLLGCCPSRPRSRCSSMETRSYGWHSHAARGRGLGAVPRTQVTHTTK